MGSAIVIDVREPAPNGDVVDEAIEACFDRFRSVDERFSMYKPGSEISRLNAGTLNPGEMSAEMSDVLSMCEDARARSDGYFDICRHRVDGAADPSGLVKGWSAHTAAKLLDAAGVVNYCINAAGDVLVRGRAEPGAPWRIGIRDPWDAAALAAIVELGDLAIATSGAYERGQHVITPHTGRPPDGIASMSVIGPDLTWADAWATAAFAMGIRGVDWIAREIDGYEACAISADRHLVMSSGFEGLLAHD
jgi:thiamine biosynthesis lipoprotein